MNSGVRRALLSAADRLAAADAAPTLRELARAAGVADWQARWAVHDLRRAGKLHIVRTRRVAYRNRPVAEYEPVSRTRAAAPCPLRACMHAWAAA